MSDLNKAYEKTKKGASWRGTAIVGKEDEEMELCVRQMKDTEFIDVMSCINTDEIEELQEMMPEDLIEEHDELTEKDELSDVEQARLESLEEEIEDNAPDIMKHLSKETFEGLQLAAQYAVEPDDADMQEALLNHAREIEETSGYPNDVSSPEHTRKWLKDKRIHPMIEDSTDFFSFELGMEALYATADEEGN